MHRKSQEAADALNNDDSGNSDREDAQSKCSDISITNLSCTSTNNKASNNMSGAASSGPTPTSNANNELSARHSVTPTSAASPSVAGKMTSPSSITTTPSPHHLATVESAAHKGGGELPPPPLVGSPPHGHYHPEADPEAFRWVDYNRDPISFIRCAFFLLKSTFLYAIMNNITCYSHHKHCWMRDQLYIQFIEK